MLIGNLFTPVKNKSGFPIKAVLHTNRNHTRPITDEYTAEYHIQKASAMLPERLSTTSYVAKLTTFRTISAA